MPEPPGRPPSTPASLVARRVVAWLRATGVRPALVASGIGAALALGAVALVVLRPAPAPPPELSLPFAQPPGAQAPGAQLPGASAVGAPGTSPPPAEVVVHAAGAVARPGLYRLGPTARVADVLDAAGGPAPDADLDRVNLAARVADGERVYVPRRGEAIPPAAGGGASTGAGLGGSRVLDLNVASVDELEALPGVGPSTAQAIVDHRARHGRFRSVDDLLDVRGIGPAKLSQIRPHVRV